MRDSIEPFISLSPEDAAGLVTAVVESARVRRRYQFFAWTQSHLQSLLPHGMLVCGVPRANGLGIFFDYFYNVPIVPAALGQLCHPREGLAVDMVEMWRKEGAEPLLINRDRAGIGQRLAEALETMGLGAAIAHGIPSEQSEHGAHGFFVFAALGRPPSPREILLVQMIVPQLFAAYCRALSREAVVASPPSAEPESSLSGREIEILRWVRDGKSNQEIGLMLGISPMTVKNHMQRILRKLQASNRTQAVTRAISRNLLPPQRMESDEAREPNRTTA